MDGIDKQKVDKLIIDTITDALDDLVTACMSEKGVTQKDLIKARSMLPKRCKNTFTKK